MCPGVPPLYESLAAHLLPPRDREALEYLDRIFRLGAQMAARANNLGASLITPQQEASSSQDDPGDYTDGCIGQINNLVNVCGGFSWPRDVPSHSGVMPCVVGTHGTGKIGL
ncbi:hypothetical protein CesoFtcFv8_024800 [Champsocephalus esox]|uniref:Uncharacterized protein n=1 Tax=Champsocephalus esox TaxID=159716 RepID=A0AAN8B3B2_9TELE|nr:hypothetical protein CesoFtcFv8_024800 [Champsocephalus esox]